MAKESLFVIPATPLATPSVQPSGKCLYNGEPGYQKRSKTQSRLETINRTVDDRLPKPTRG